MASNESKLCECGCGRFTTLATQTNTAKGRIKGKPNRFCPGHPGSNRTKEEGFWSHARKDPANEDACWQWIGDTHPGGYGQFMHKRKLIYGHRASYEIHYGPIPKGMQVCHKCDNPPCCNPRHLVLGTLQYNAKDRTDKGRTAHGEKHGAAKLTADLVAKIKGELVNRAETWDAIASRYGVTRMAIIKISQGKTWAHVPNPKCVNGEVPS